MVNNVYYDYVYNLLHVNVYSYRRSFNFRDVYV